MRFPVLVLVFVSGLPGATTARANAEERWNKIDRIAARRLLRVAERARRAKQHATAGVFLGRALDLWPDASAARRLLGYRKRRGEWTRDAEQRGRVAAWSDSDRDRGTQLRSEARKVERWRATLVLQESRRDGALSDDDRVRLRAALAKAPDAEDVHEALGHRWTGARWVRPELEALYARHVQVERALEELRQRASRVRALEPRPLPGVDGVLPVYDAGGAGEVGFGPAFKGPTSDHTEVAADVDRATRLFQLLFADLTRVWQPPRVFLVSTSSYRKVLAAVVPDPSERKLARRYRSYEVEPHFVFSGNDLADALDTLVHTLGFRTAWYTLSQGDDAAGAGQAWFYEAVAYLATLELLGRAETYFHSIAETSPKATHAREPPERSRTRAACRVFLQESLVDARAPKLTEIIGRPLNGLDLLSSLQGWSFLRFLLARDAGAVRSLVAEMRAKDDVVDARLRARRAIEAATGSSSRGVGGRVAHVRSGDLVRLACLLVVATWVLCPSASLAFPSEEIEIEVRRAVERIDAAGTAWHVVTVIPDLDARYGVFGDLDGDGDEDYVATEMLHGEERITTYLREGDAWRRVARGGPELQSRHPLLPWILPDDGTGKAAIVVPTGWPPYVMIYPTDGNGRLAAGVSLQRALPRRVSRPMGVDNNPYSITGVVAGTRGRGARIEGEIWDENDTRARGSSWRIAWRRGVPPRRTQVRAIPDKALSGVSEVPTAVRPAGGRGACDHVHPRRSAILHSAVFDVDGDSVDDVVHVSADFAAHVFRGERRGKTLAFDAPTGSAHPIPLVEARWWLGRPRDATGNWWVDGARQVEIRRFIFEERPGADVPLLIGNPVTPYVCAYVWTGRRLAPSYRARRRWPQPKTSLGAGEQIPEAADTKYWREIWRDATGDGSPDSLAVGVSRDFDFVGPWRDGKKAYRHGGDARPVHRLLGRRVRSLRRPSDGAVPYRCRDPGGLAQGAAHRPRAGPRHVGCGARALVHLRSSLAGGHLPRTGPRAGRHRQSAHGDAGSALAGAGGRVPGEASRARRLRRRRLRPGAEVERRAVAGRCRLLRARRGTRHGPRTAGARPPRARPRPVRLGGPRRRSIGLSRVPGLRGNRGRR